MAQESDESRASANSRLRWQSIFWQRQVDWDLAEDRIRNVTFKATDVFRKGREKLAEQAIRDELPAELRDMAMKIRPAQLAST